MKKLAILAAVAAATVATPAAATEAFTVLVTKTADNVYKVDRRNIYIKTTGCAVESKGHRAILIVNNASALNGRLTFVNTRRSCTISYLSMTPPAANVATKAATPVARATVAAQPAADNFDRDAARARKAAADVLAALRGL